MPKTRPANPGQVRVRTKWYVSRQSNFLALSLTNSNCPDRTRILLDFLHITEDALTHFFRQVTHTVMVRGEAAIACASALKLYLSERIASEADASTSREATSLFSAQ